MNAFMGRLTRSMGLALELAPATDCEEEAPKPDETGQRGGGLESRPGEQLCTPPRPLSPPPEVIPVHGE